MTVVVDIAAVCASEVQVGDRIVLDGATPTVTVARRYGWESFGEDTRVEFTFDVLQDRWDPEGGPARMNYGLTDTVTILRRANRKAAA